MNDLNSTELILDAIDKVGNSVVEGQVVIMILIFIVWALK